MAVTDHGLFIVQAVAGVLALIPMGWYVLRPLYKYIKKSIHKFFINLFTDGAANLINQIVTDTIHPYIKELIPNGGSSLNDTINLQILPMLKENNKGLARLGNDFAKLEGRFEQYVKDVDPRIR